MKTKLLTIICTLIASFTLVAQSNKEEIDLLQSVFGMEKKAVVASFVHPGDAQKDAFWDLYDEYETKRKVLGKKRIELLKQYAGQWENMTDEQADAWMKEVLKLKAQTDQLLKVYYNKVRKTTSAIVATQFFQIESYLLTVIRYTILEGIPFVGEK